MSLTVEMMAPICWVFSLRSRMVTAMLSTCSRMLPMPSTARSRAWRPCLEDATEAWAFSATWRAASDTCADVRAISSEVAIVSSTEAACSSTPLLCCAAAELSSLVTPPRDSAAIFSLWIMPERASDI